MQEPCPEWIINLINQIKEENPYGERYDGEFRCGYEDALDTLLEKLGVET